MTSFLFWNLNRKELVEEAAALIHERSVDVAIFAEMAFSIEALRERLNTHSYEATYFVPYNPSTRLNFICRLPTNGLSLIADSEHVSIRHVRPAFGPDVILVAVHTSSKLFTKTEDYPFICRRIAADIEQAELTVGHDRTIVMGDLNQNPFEAGVVAADGLHAIMDKNIALRRTRIVQGVRRKFFYNPMWGRLGDGSIGKPGTYFFRESSMVAYFWHTFDQILIRPDLLGYFDENKLHVIDQIGDTSLCNKAGPLDEYSDHLPIFVELNNEEVNSNDNN